MFSNIDLHVSSNARKKGEFSARLLIERVEHEFSVEAGKFNKSSNGKRLSEVGTKLS